MQRPLFRFAALAAAATTTSPSPSRPAAATARSQPLSAHAAASASVLIDDARAVARRELAVQALLTNLIDDADPPRFADTDQPLVCGQGSTVHVNGAPLEPGAVIPAASFTLDFQLAGACPSVSPGRGSRAWCTWSSCATTRPAWCRWCSPSTERCRPRGLQG